MSILANVHTSDKLMVKRKQKFYRVLLKELKSEGRFLKRLHAVNIIWDIKNPNDNPTQFALFICSY